MVNEQEHQSGSVRDETALFGELGARLRALRQSKGLELADAARHIKLSERTLLSIEEGRQGDLPHTVYAKGFVRTYAQLLGMPEAEIGETLNAVFPPEEEEYSAPVILMKPARKSSPVGTIIILLLLAILAIGGWYVYSNVISKGSEEQPAAPAATSAPAAPAAHAASADSEADARANLANFDSQPSPESLRTSDPAETDMPDQASSAADRQTDTSSPVSAGDDTAASGSQAGTAGGGANADVEGPIYFESGRGLTGDGTDGQAQAVASTGAKKHRVVVTATEECWIKATTDKGDERPFNLPKNQSSVFTFDEFLKLRLGNAAGVKIRYNGRDFPIPASGGNTRDMVFPPRDS